MFGIDEALCVMFSKFIEGIDFLVSNRRYRVSEFVLTRYKPEALPAIITEVVVD